MLDGPLAEFQGGGNVRAAFELCLTIHHLDLIRPLVFGEDRYKIILNHHVKLTMLVGYDLEAFSPSFEVERKISQKMDVYPQRSVVATSQMSYLPGFT
jgi:hypothetical protein